MKTPKIPDWIFAGPRALPGTDYTTSGFKTKAVLNRKLKAFSHLGEWKICPTIRHGAVGVIFLGKAKVKP